MAQRNVPKIEWAIELPSAPAQPAPTPPIEYGPMPLRDLPGLSPLDVVPLEKAGIKTTADLANIGASGDQAAVLCAVDGIGPKRAQKIRDAFLAAQLATIPDFHPPTGDWRPTVEAAFTALDRAADFSHGQLVLSTGYPRFLELDGKTYIVIRWGGAALHQQYYLRLRKVDPRFHKCPPLSNADTGMAGCWKEP